MLLLDTHIWIWWVAQDGRLPGTQLASVDGKFESYTELAGRLLF